MIKRGLPTVLLVNENFLVATEAMAKSYGLSQLPTVVFPTNMDSMPEEEIIELTGKGFPEVVRKLVWLPSGDPKQETG